MDFTDASPFDVDNAQAAIRHGILSSILLGLLGVAVAAGGYAFDRYAGPGASVTERAQL